MLPISTEYRQTAAQRKLQRFFYSPDMNANEQLRNLVVMAVADGSLGEREVNLLADRCQELGLGEPELKKALQFALADDAKVSLPSTPAEREALLVDLLRMMAADGSLEEPEKRLFALVAAKAGLDGPEVNRLIDRELKK